MAARHRKSTYPRLAREPSGSTELAEIAKLPSTGSLKDYVPKGSELNEELCQYIQLVSPVYDETLRLPKMYLLMKRVMDLALVLLAAPVFLPVFLGLFLIQWVVLGRKIFYTQTRMGMHMRPFEIIKFRTLVENANVLKKEHKLGEKIKNPNLYTPIGKFLRDYRLDELPQVINVLIGDMSLVGPRPFTVIENVVISRSQLIRFSRKPGITGLWQCRRSTFINAKSKFRYDRIYSRTHSVLYDCLLLLQTIPVLLRKETRFPGKGTEAKPPHKKAA